MKFSGFANYLDKLEKTASRLEITETLADLYKKLKAEEIDKATYLLLGKLAPGYENIVFNVAEKMMIQAVAKAYEVKPEIVLKEYKRLGDLGDVAEGFSKSRDTRHEIRDTNVKGVYQKLLSVAEEQGEGSVERKIEGLANLLKSVDPLSARFIARIPVGKLRLGFSDKTIIDALSWMETGGKSESNKLEKAYFVVPDVGLLARAVKEKGIEKAVKGVKPKVGVPVLPMLPARLKSPAEMIEKMGEVSVEPKFDGLRIQIHYKKKEFAKAETDSVKVFTRNLNETSWMFPELKNAGKHINANEAILDTEAMGVDEKTKALANFQATMTRRRKHDIEKTRESIGIKFYVFDVLYKDGKSLMNKTYKERRKVLSETVKSGKLLQIVDYEITKDAKVIEKLMKKELAEGLEGIIVKRTDSNYVAGRTGWRWVKMKEAEDAHAKLADTIDCVVMGYTRGKGRRAGFGVGQFLAGIRDKGKIKTVTKVGTGITDEEFGELNKRLSGLTAKEKPKEYEVHKNLEPDFWVTPSLIVELAADEITKSPSHTAGFALRFPRLIKFRDDKSVNQATTLGEVKKLFKLQ